MELSRLTDAEIAFLTYACQEEHDSVSIGDGTGSFTGNKRLLVDAGLKFRTLFEKEYNKRKLHHSMF